MLVCAPAYAQNTVDLHVDATGAASRVIHVRMSMPAKPGPMTLLYPEWIPGEHGPTGPIANLVGLKFSERRSRHRLETRQRQYVRVPCRNSRRRIGSRCGLRFRVAARSQRLHIGSLHHQRVSDSQLESAAAVSGRRGRRQRAIPRVSPTAAHLEVRHRACRFRRKPAAKSIFRPASLTTLVDSPVSTGAHYRTIDLGAGGHRSQSAALSPPGRGQRPRRRHFA